MENDLKGNENWFELAGGSSHRGFESPRVDCKHGENRHTEVLAAVISQFNDNNLMFIVITYFI